MSAQPKKISRKSQYAKIESIDGDHPLKARVPGSYVDYPVRKRKRGKVVFFNFELAKEMGLIAKNHDHIINEQLEKTLLDTFSNIIINEHDMINGKKFPAEDIKDNTFMATRYLQLQHPNKRGMTSGDGRSIWNGKVTNKGVTWDVSSCGTGATCLSPATAINNQFYQSGDPSISYGCGYSMLSEGIIDVLFSEILHKNHHKTERVLCVIGYPGGFGVTVRAGRNLLRPSHFFNHLRQGQLRRLTSIIDYFIERQIENGDWQAPPKSMDKYDYMLEQVTQTFAEISANFESDYLFVWLDWDGDNILADGGIIDFGSVRQFGLFHHEYRFDDVERWSTTIKEQKVKAKYIVQTFAQIVDYIHTGKKKPTNAFRNHKALARFQRIFREKKRSNLLEKCGFSLDQIPHLMKFRRHDIKKLEDAFYYLERRKSRRGPIRVSDGVNWNAVFSVRDLLREMPRIMAEYTDGIAPASEVVKIMKTGFASRADCKVTRSLEQRTRDFQYHFNRLHRWQAKRADIAFGSYLDYLQQKLAIIHKPHRITGDAVVVVGDHFVDKSKKFDSVTFHQAITAFVEEQSLVPGSSKRASKDLSIKLKGFHETLLKIVQDYREGL